MLNFASNAGKDISEVFTGLTDYNIERTYLMAKNIVENETIQNEYSYYNIGTNVITFTPGLDGSEYIYEFNDVQCTSINQKYVDEYNDVLGVKGWKMP